MPLKKYLLGLTMISLMVFSGCSESTTEDTEIPAREQEAIITPTTSLSSPIESNPEEIHPLPGGRIPLIYDDDGSRDGMAALIYLLILPEFSVEAINISYGEAHPEVYIQHVARVLDELGYQNLSFGAGQDEPLAGGTPFPDWLRQLSDNFWDYPIPNLAKTYPTQNAADMFVSTINQKSEPVTIFLSGTFTNLAQALRIDPEIKEHIAAVYFMGGAVHGPGNITNLLPDSSNTVAEWNIISDPQAAKEVFGSGLELFMIPLDATNQVKHRLEEVNRWHQGDQNANFVADLYEIMFIDYGFESVEIFDLTAAVIMAEPESCSFQSFHLEVITEEGDTLGQTRIVPDSDPNIHVCLEPNVNLVKQHLDDIFTAADPPAETEGKFPIAGTWTGTASNAGFEMQVSITIADSCQLDTVCGHFDIPTASCSGTLTWVGMDGAMFQFEAGEKAEGCGDGTDYLVPQQDGTVLYLSIGDYGETKGILQRGP